MTEADINAILGTIGTWVSATSPLLVYLWRTGIRKFAGRASAAADPAPQSQHCQCCDAVQVLARQVERLAQAVEEQNINRGVLIEGGRTHAGSRAGLVATLNPEWRCGSCGPRLSWRTSNKLALLRSAGD
ncbi:hypothetical protein BDV35DRAFT_389851 [Aspergillus flavus]|uniref:Uncharacterized protein n=1 Tax=Aspergillus flavus TaxID=5059 RepID=A0A5N6HAN8_ASPFL|nr:hypothetical protein BDV35DRAFT_389851 [Aspergillus flavus]